jgi:hypothetical protein
MNKYNTVDPAITRKWKVERRDALRCAVGGRFRGAGNGARSSNGGSKTNLKVAASLALSLSLSLFSFF